MYTLPLISIVETDFHHSWNSMVWYVYMPTWHCELQCNGKLLIQQLNINHKK